MNSVHFVTQEKILSQTGPKTGRLHRVHSPKPAHAPRPLTQRPGRGPATSCRALPSARYRLPRAPTRAQGSHARAARAYCRPPACLPACPVAAHLCTPPAAARPVSCLRAPRAPYSPSRAPSACPAPTCAPSCAVLWPCSVLYRNIAPDLGLCCHNTIFVLRYNFPAALLQYNPSTLLLPACNTISIAIHFTFQ